MIPSRRVNIAKEEKKKISFASLEKNSLDFSFVRVHERKFRAVNSRPDPSGVKRKARAGKTGEQGRESFEAGGWEISFRPRSHPAGYH